MYRGTLIIFIPHFRNNSCTNTRDLYFSIMCNSTSHLIFHFSYINLLCTNLSVCTKHEKKVEDSTREESNSSLALNMKLNMVKDAYCSSKINNNRNYITISHIVKSRPLTKQSVLYMCRIHLPTRLVQGSYSNCRYRKLHIICKLKSVKIFGQVFSFQIL